MTKKAITPTELRADLYRLLDRVLETGEALEIVRKGRTLKITREERKPRLDELEPHPDFIEGDPEDLVHLDWSGEWNP